MSPLRPSRGSGHPGDLHPAPGSSRRGRYLGRGRSSGHGKTSGRGFKGQMSRTGAKRRPGFMGGDMRLVLRMPKRGFLNPFRVELNELNVSDLAAAFPAGGVEDPAALAALGLLGAASDRVKILGDGECTAKLTVSAHAFSGPAKKKIEAAGGTCVLLP